MLLGDPQQSDQRAKLPLPHRRSSITRPCCSIERSSAKLLVFTCTSKFERSTGSECVDVLGLRAVEVIICMITRDFSVISMTSQASLSLSLSLSLPLTKVTDAYYRKRTRASYNMRTGPICMYYWKLLLSYQENYPWVPNHILYIVLPRELSLSSHSTTYFILSYQENYPWVPIQQHTLYCLTKRIIPEFPFNNILYIVFPRELSLSSHSTTYSGSHLFYAKLWTVADQKPMVKKIWKNMKNHGMVCPPPQNQKEEKTLRDPTIITFPHFLRTLGCFDVKCAQLRVVELTTAYA